MKSSRSLRGWLVVAAFLITGAICLQAELPSWTQDAIAASALESALFRIMGVPDGTVIHLRPPWESRAHLAKLIQQSPHNAELYSIRAHEDERMQDYASAERDWKQFAAHSEDKLAALGELADFFHRRNQPEAELSTLLMLGGTPPIPSERFQPDAQQAQWAAFTRAITVANDALLPALRHREIYEAWIRRYPKDNEPYQEYLEWAIRQRDRETVAAVATGIKKAFPDDIPLVIATDAHVAELEIGLDAGLAVYAKNFSPLWPDTLRTQYFQALSAAHQLRILLSDAQTASANHPTDLNPVLRLFFYYEQENRKDVADQQLILLMARRTARNAPWSADELKIAAPLFLRVQDYDECAYSYYKLYEVPSTSPADKELALASLISLLLDIPEQPVHFGNRDLTLYKNIAQMDRHPGFLNGVLSLALNTTFPSYQYQNASQNAVSYFHRASASRLISEFRRQFPNSRRTPELEAKLFNAYAVYGQYDAVIRYAPGWLSRNPNSPEFVDVAFVLADAYIQNQNSSEELALYDRLLAKLSAESDHMPLGEHILKQWVEVGGQATTATVESGGARSPDYARVLDRYISRLVQLNRQMDAVALFRREIDANPDDPGIYERLALFLEQNRLDKDVEQTYRQAFAHFKDRSWASKLARFYLREKQYRAYEELARQITETFRGSELGAFLTEVPPNSPTLYRQVNLYAHQRFPHNPIFVRNLLHCYTSRATYDAAAYEKLLREYWFYDSSLRTSFFQYLSSSGRLAGELAALPSVEQATKDSNVAALEFRAEGQAWLTQYETAAPAFVELAAMAPGDREVNARAISIERSLAPEISSAFTAAIRLAQQEVKAAPSDREALTRVGEIYADRDRYSQARPWWNRVAALEPGSPGGYLDSVTVFWDYFQFDDALRVISEARHKLGPPARFAYEAGAIYENKNQYPDAIAAYIQAVLHDSSEQAKNRLITLAKRKNSAALVESETQSLTAHGFNESGFRLRLAILENQNRRGDIEKMLADLLPDANTTGEIDEIRGVANRLGFDQLAAQAMQGTVSITTDPIEKLQARIDLARFYESHNDAPAAEREFSALLKDDPNVLGVIRAAVDFYWREKKGQPAVATLEAAAERAQQPYQNELRREAAEKATQSGQFDQARRLLDQLLKNDPYNGDLLAEKAATFARANDNSGLVTFYAAELTAMQAAPLASQDKTTRIAALRRGYILALTATGQFTDALEQYQLVLNAYPEDASLAAEVSRFAEAHQLAPRLVAYYAKATTDSPRDYRWPLVLARVETALRDYPQAIAAYEKAAHVRPDRSDLLVSKADLETRLLRFDAAIQTYRKLYDLTYHDSQYLADQATLYARLGNKAEALRLLRAAYIEPHPHEPAGYIGAMRLLSDWHMFDAVDELFREVRPLLARIGASTNDASTLEAAALTSMHRPSDAIDLVAAMVDNSAQTESFAITIGTAAQQYLTPEEKSLLSDRISKTDGLPPQFNRLQFARAASFAEVQAQLLFEALLKPDEGLSPWQLDQLQSSRLHYEELGRQLEQVAGAQQGSSQYQQVMRGAFQAYANAGDTASELRLADYAGPAFPRLFVSAGGDLNARLAELARYDPKRADTVLQYLFSHASPDTVAGAIDARGSRISTLWKNSFKALAGLYFLSPVPWVSEAFDSALGPRTVSDELSTLSSSNALRGQVWLYYAARYGDYLAYRKNAMAGDYLPASLEARPAASDSYLELADTYKDVSQPARARELYRYALQLSPDRADIYDRLGILAVASNQRTQAIADWRHAFQLLAARVEKGPLPPQYWQTARSLLADMNRFDAVSELKPDADAMLRAYAKRNLAYNFTPFLQGIFDHARDKHAALDWIIELSNLPGMDQLLGEVIAPKWIPESEKDALYRARIDRARKAVETAVGQQPIEEATQQLSQRMIEYARYLEQQARYADEWAVLQEIQTPSGRPQDLVLISGALSGHLDDLFKQYGAEPEATPAGEVVLAAAFSLDKLGHHDLALRIEEFEYSRELETGSPPASAWFGLARVRFEQKRDQDGLSLIRDATLSVGAPFENLPEAVCVLEDAGRKQEAARYAEEWRKAEPWDGEAQLASARLNQNETALDELRRSPQIPYSIRVRAARFMRDMGHSVSGSDELALLTHKSINAAEASKPFYIAARLDAAHQSSIASEKLALLGDAIATDPNLDEPRLDFAEAAFSARHDALGLAAFQSYRNETPGSSWPDNFWIVEQLAAGAAARQHDFSRALQLYADLLNQTKEPAKHALIEKARDSIAEKQSLEAANAARQPRISKEIAQSLIVKPKLNSLPADSIAGVSQGDEQ